MSRDENPYAAPLTAPDELGPLRRILPPTNVRFWLRFTATLVVMVGLNLWTLRRTWDAFYLDGYREVGWPWVFYRYGPGDIGGILREYFYAAECFGDAILALSVPCLVAAVLRVNQACTGAVRSCRRSPTPSPRSTLRLISFWVKNHSPTPSRIKSMRMTRSILRCSER